jgi:hypothetical protein
MNRYLLYDIKLFTIHYASFYLRRTWRQEKTYSISGFQVGSKMFCSLDYITGIPCYSPVTLWRPLKFSCAVHCALKAGTLTGLLQHHSILEDKCRDRRPCLKMNYHSPPVDEVCLKSSATYLYPVLSWMILTVKMTLFCDSPRSVIHTDRRFRGSYCLRRQGGEWYSANVS